MTPQHFLALHVYLRVCDDYAVLFDIKRGKYLTLDSGQANRLTPHVAGWPLNRAAPTSEGAVDRTIERLTAAGLLTTQAHLGKSAEPPAICTPESAFAVFELERTLRPHLRYFGKFLVACTRAKLHFRDLQMVSLVQDIRARRAQWSAGSVADVEVLRRLVKAHYHLRPLVYSAFEACLFDSLVLLEFLALHRVDATWVFGVQTGPFAAHCWLQAGKLVLNDSAEHVLHYSPILSV